jgi:hypothetical protein
MPPSHMRSAAVAIMARRAAQVLSYRLRVLNLAAGLREGS